MKRALPSGRARDTFCRIADTPEEAPMSVRRPAPKATPAARPGNGQAKVDGKTASPYGYPFWDWVAKEDPEYVRARGPLSQLSVGEGKAMSIKHREMVIIGILAFRGREDGVVTHMRRAIQHGATKRELLEAIESAAVPGGGPTFSTGVQALMQLDREGAFKG
jgi:alkylhydroperoxidase/carboxymuconolactone decarboxylase family protein YurZ